MCIAANSVFKISSNRFIVITILFSMSAQPAAAAGFVFFLTGARMTVKDKRVSYCVPSTDQRQRKLEVEQL